MTHWSEKHPSVIQLEGETCDNDYRASIERMRPFMLIRPKLYPDGNQWCCLYGENVQEGVVGFGASPELATREFDKEWYEELRQQAGEP